MNKGRKFAAAMLSGCCILAGALFFGSGNAHASGYRLSTSDIYLISGQADSSGYDLVYNGPESATDWQVEDSSIASIEKTSNHRIHVMARKAGSTTITTTVNGKTYICKVRVEEPALDQTEISMNTGTGSTLTLKDCSENSVWSTSSDSIELKKISDNSYTVMARKAGTAYVNINVHGAKYQCKVIVADHTHDYDVQRVEPTCETDGSVTYTCKTCGESHTEVLKALGHDYQATDKKDATCASEGYTRYTCTRCSDSYTETIPVKAHTPGDWATVKGPSCTEAGLQEQRCTVCDTVLDTREIPATGHTKGEWQTVKESTCTEKGLQEQHCTVCGELLETREIPAKGHVEGEWKIVKEATCTEDGSKELHCKTCGELIQTEVIKAAGHDYQVTATVDPTCTKDGYKVYKCNKCNDTYTEILKATGHTVGEWKTVKEATCTEKGLQEQRCTVCGELLDAKEIPAKGHNAGTWKTVKEATCTEDGLKELVCGSCGEVIRTETLSKLGHDYQVTDRKAATCEEAGYIQYTCTRCSDSHKESIPATGHKEGSWKVTKEATCTENGTKTLLCETCGKVMRTEEIKATGHKYQEVSRTDATCSQEGSITYKCSVCGDTHTDAIPKTEHNWKVIYHSDPGCTHGEETTYECTECGELKGTETGEPLGHNFVFKRRFKEPTCTTAGRDDYECTRCHTLQFHDVPALGHDLHVKEHHAPTCQDYGWDDMECSRCGYEYIDNRTETIDHIAGEWEVETEPTDLTYGRKVKRCTMCGLTMESEKILPTNEEQNQNYTIELKKGETTEVYGHYEEELTQELYRLVNEYRIKNGLEAYVLDENLEKMAQTRVLEIDYKFDHSRPNGKDIGSLCDYVDGENIGFTGIESAEQILQMFIDSPPHNAALLSTSPNFGISVFANRLSDDNYNAEPYGLLIVMDFGTPLVVDK